MNNREILARNIVDKYKDLISGTAVDAIQWVDRDPESEIYIGKLSSITQGDAFSSNVLIQQISVDFRILESELENTVVRIFPQGNFFYRVMPTIDQQREYAVKEAQTSFKELGIRDYSHLLELAKARKLVRIIDGKESDFRVKLVEIYEKIAIDNGAYFDVRLKDIYDSTIGYGEVEEFEGDGEHRILSPLFQSVEDHINLLNSEITKEKAIQVVFRTGMTILDLENQESWEAYIKKQEKGEEFRLSQNFRYRLDVIVKKSKDLLDITVALSNKTECMDESGDKNDRKKDRYKISTLFNSGLRVELVNAKFYPIELDYFADDYKYDRNVFALGNNCNISYIEEDNAIQTTHLPIFEQYRLKTNDSINASFDDLIADPVKTLEKINIAMKRELGEWEEFFNEKKSDLTARAKDDFRKEIDAFRLEMERFTTGIKLIKNYNWIKDAFIYMNQSFKNSSKGYSSWRLFQIVFIVSLILDVVASEEDLGLDEDIVIKAKTDDVDILYFPTGGGKTEAFLGIIVFNLFFDRIRGKKHGVTAILKYPLRLLSIQQVQRLSDILASAEIIRREKFNGKHPFSLGYYTGDANTPNEISEQQMKKYAEMPLTQLNEEIRILDKCPFCGSESMYIHANIEQHKLEHHCSNKECPSEGILPLYIVDNEIYRYLPSVIISTIDKMAAIGFQRNFRSLLCGAEKYCPTHGFIPSIKCAHKPCKNTISDFKDITMKDPAPTLMIQDELHLIKESLGAFDSHYETFIEHFIRSFNAKKRGIKIIGATATITQCETQARHLYDKKAIRFPCASPYIDKNFYSYIDKNELNRIIIGYAPFGKAIINSVVYALQYLRKIIFHLYNNPQEIVDMPHMELTGTPEQKLLQAKELMEDYWVLLQYNNVKMDGNKVISAIADPINTQLIAEGISPLVPEKMTGDDKFQDVRKLLSRLEHADSIVNDLDFNLIVATSMISHGVDADRFNMMLFYGMPGNTAEYIQAYSRVGRKHVGVVIDIMRPAREKDHSYLKTFNKFHEFKDILVDSVPINRWATKTIDCTLPGVVSGIIINHYSRQLCKRLDLMGELKDAIVANELQATEIKEHLYGIYKCSDGDAQIGKPYKTRIDELVDELFEGIRTTIFDKYEFISSGFEKIGFHIMTSLRDTDKQLSVQLE